MDPAVWVGILALVGTTVTAYGTWVGKKGDTHIAFTKSMMEQLNATSVAVVELRAEIDEERTKRRREEDRSWELLRALKEGLGVMREVAGWLRDGSPPPPPDIEAAVIRIEEVVTRIKD